MNIPIPQGISLTIPAITHLLRNFYFSVKKAHEQLVSCYFYVKYSVQMVMEFRIKYAASASHNYQHLSCHPSLLKSLEQCHGISNGKTTRITLKGRHSKGFTISTEVINGRSLFSNSLFPHVISKW